MDMKKAITGTLKGTSVGKVVGITKEVAAEVYEFISIYETQLKIENALAQAIKVTGQSTQHSVNNLKDMAMSLQSVTKYSDDAILPITQLLIETTKLSKEAMPSATEMVLDLSTALGVDLKSAAGTVSSILNEPATAIDKLRKLHVDLSEEQQRSIEKFIAQGDQAQAQKIILDQLSESYGGLARAEGDLVTSKSTQFKNVWTDIKEEIGEGLSLLLSPVIDPVFDWGLGMMESVRDFLNTSNNLVAQTDVKRLSDKELNEVYNELAPNMESWERNRNIAEKNGDYMTVADYDGFIEQYEKYLSQLTEEINSRTQSSRWGAMNTHGQQQLEKAKETAFLSGSTGDARQAFADETSAERAFLRSQGVDTSTTYSAQLAGEAIKEETAKAEADAAEKAIQMARDLLSAKEAVYAISGNTTELEKIQIQRQMESLEAQKKSYQTKIDEGELTTEAIAEYEALIGLLDTQVKLQKESYENVGWQNSEAAVKELLSAKEAVYSITGDTVELEKLQLQKQIDGLQKQKESYLEKIKEGQLTAENIKEYEHLIELLDKQIALQQDAVGNVEQNAQQKELNAFLTANSGLIQRTAADEIEHYQNIIAKTKELVALSDEEQKQLDAIVASATEHVAALENSEKIAQQKELTNFLQANKNLLEETILDEIAHYDAIIASAMAQKQLTNLTAEQNRQLDEILDNAEKQKKAIYDSNTPLAQFLSDNSKFVPKPAELTTEQKTSELLGKRKDAVSYLTNIESNQQRGIPITPEDVATAETLREIISGIDAELDSLSGKSVFEELHDALNLDMLKEGNITGFLSNIGGAIADAKEIIQKNFGDIISFGKGFFQTFSNMSNENSESELETLEKRIAEEEQLRDQQLRQNEDRYNDQSDSLDQLYAAGKISYENYIAGQLALDEEKTQADDEAVTEVAELERQKLAIENKAAKAQFDNNKLQNMADAAMSGAAAFVQALKLGPIAGPIAAAVIAGMTAAQVAVIGAQQFTPKTALAQGGIVSGPTTALIGEGGEPEMVLPLSKAEDMGFTGRNETQIVININAPIYTSDDLTDHVYEGIRLAQRTGRLPRWA